LVRLARLGIDDRLEAILGALATQLKRRARSSRLRYAVARCKAP
jgi:hypothetical protein